MKSHIHQAKKTYIAIIAKLEEKKKKTGKKQYMQERVESLRLT